MKVNLIKRRFLTIGMIILMSGVLTAATNVTKFGRNPFLRPSLTSVDDFVTKVQASENDVKQAFKLAGHADLFDPFMDQLPYTDIEIVDFDSGTSFQWMFYKKNGTTRVAKNVKWVNKNSFTGFKFSIDKDGYRYNFGTPLVCGNIALLGVSPIPAVYVPPVVAAVIPDCMENGFWNSASENCDCLDGFKKNSLGNCEKIVIKPVIEKPNVIVPALAAATALKLIADLGGYHQFDPATYLFGRIGAEYAFNDKFSLLGLVGYAPKISDEDGEGESAFLLDLLGEYKFGGRHFFDLGVGGWITDGDDDDKTEDTQVDLISAIGTRIFGDPEDFNISLFLEGRAGFGELSSYDDLSSYGRWGGGLRFRF